MKWVVLTITLLLSFSSFAISHKEFIKLSRTEREKVIKAYMDFLREYQKTIKLSSAEPGNFSEFIQSAYASDYDCVYGGWPSRRINNLCSLPRTNPSFQRESCSDGQMPCQPLLFGRGVCVPSATREQRNSSFSNCQRRFSDLGRDLAEVVDYVSDPEISTEADELFRLVDQICSTGAQSNTGMCRNLRSRVSEIQDRRRSQGEVPTVTISEMPQIRVEESFQMTQVVTDVAVRINEIPVELNTTPQCVSCESMREQTVDEPERPVTSPRSQIRSPFPRIDSGYDLAACGGSQGTNDGYSLRSIGSCSSSERVSAGFSFRPGPGHPHMNVQTRYPGGSAPGRFFDILSRNEAFNETYLVMEEYGGGPDSHNVKSYMFVIPRVTVPSVRVEGNNIIATLPTGETVTMDKNTRAITGGALTEGPIDLNTDRFQRRPPNIHYSGSGISIRLDHRFEHPLTSSATATVKQGSRTCNVPRASILDDNGKLKTSSDQDLLRVLNQNCRGGGFALP